MANKENRAQTSNPSARLPVKAAKIADRNTKIQLPLQKFAKEIFKDEMLYAHNSLHNPNYPKQKDLYPKRRSRFKVAGNRLTKEFLYCCQVIKGLYKYRPKMYEPPIIRGFTGVEWPEVKNILKLQYGEEACCTKGEVMVVLDDMFIGGDHELKEYIDSHYVYHLMLDYYHLSVEEFAKFISSSQQRPCAYMHIACDEIHIGSFVFMLYADLVPKTCENFMRLCCAKKDGYSGTTIHRIVKDGWIQCGGFGMKETPLGCENFIVPHDQRGILCMANDGRNRHCSTQFFILLQPAPWMDDKYVAFGQLIDGRKLLDMLEEQPTYYESPKADIRIIDAGVLNMECHGITVSKGTNEFIQSHIEDLNELARLLWNLLLENLWLELEFKKIVSKQPEKHGEGHGHGEQQRVVHDSIRFMRSKEDVQDDLEKKKGHSSDSREDLAAEDEADMDDDTNWSPETYSYQQITPPPERIYPIAPFYIPLTDVPYPGEVTSEYDLKKFLRGDYCLEADIMKTDGVNLKDMERLNYEKVEKTLFSSEPNLILEDKDTVSFIASNPEEERIIKDYLQQYTDSVSFAGTVIKHIPKTPAYSNILLTKKSTSLGSHIIQPTSALLSSERSNRSKKRVEIAGMEYLGHERYRYSIRRGQTGVRQAILEKLTKFTKADDILNPSLLSLETGKRHVLLRAPVDDESKVGIQRRPTGFVHSATLNYDIDDDDDDGDNENDNNVDDNYDKYEPKNKYKVKLEEDSSREERRETKSAFRPFKQRESIRMSVFDKLEPLPTTDSLENQRGPTLKQYQPTMHEDDTSKNLLLTDNPNTQLFKIEEAPKDKFIQRTADNTDSYKLIMAMQHGNKIAGHLSLDYFRTMEQIGKKPEASIRGYEYAKRRPTLSVNQYKQQNKTKEQPSEKTLTTLPASATIENPKIEYVIKKDLDLLNIFSMQAITQGSRKPIYRGLRMPGDTPLYLSEETIRNLKKKIK